MEGHATGSSRLDHWSLAGRNSVLEAPLTDADTLLAVNVGHIVIVRVDLDAMILAQACAVEVETLGLCREIVAMGNPHAWVLAVGLDLRYD